MMNNTLTHYMTNTLTHIIIIIIINRTWLTFPAIILLDNNPPILVWLKLCNVEGRYTMGYLALDSYAKFNSTF